MKRDKGVGERSEQWFQLQVQDLLSVVDRELSFHVLDQLDSHFQSLFDESLRWKC